MAQVPPPVPQAVAAPPGWHTPLVSQQPEQEEELHGPVPVHTWLVQVCSDSQVLQTAAPVPHAAVVLPGMQVSPWQHPLAQLSHVPPV
jgi:hypothetical protein